jgi:hypothetical protein
MPLAEPLILTLEGLRALLAGKRAGYPLSGEKNTTWT